MKTFKTLPTEMLCFFVLVSAIVIRISFPEVAEFWLALVTAITLFLILHLRSHLDLKTEAEEEPSP